MSDRRSCICRRTSTMLGAPCPGRMAARRSKASCRDKVRRSVARKSEVKTWNRSVGPAASTRAVPPDLAASSRGPLAPSSSMEGLLSMYRARVLAPPASAPSAPSRMGWAKARTMQDRASRRISRTSQCRMRLRERLSCLTSLRNAVWEKRTLRWRRKLNRWTSTGMVSAESAQRTSGWTNCIGGRI